MKDLTESVSSRAWIGLLDLVHRHCCTRTLDSTQSLTPNIGLLTRSSGLRPIRRDISHRLGHHGFSGNNRMMPLPSWRTQTRGEHGPAQRVRPHHGTVRPSLANAPSWSWLGLAAMATVLALGCVIDGVRHLLQGDLASAALVPVSLVVWSWIARGALRRAQRMR